MKTLYEWCIENNREDLLNEWHSLKNGNSTPHNVSIGSDTKYWWKCSKGHEWNTRICERIKQNQGCPVCANKKILKGYNDLATTNPELLKEWDFEKNTDISPYEISAGSHKKVWWKCKHGHSWCVSPKDRQKHNCPYCCNQKILKGFNDLATTNPELLEEWDFEKNTDISPYEISAGTHKKVWWKCKNGHSWFASIVHKRNGRGCPYCSNKKILKGYNDLATTNPELLEEWDFEKNTDISPYKVGSGSSKKVWWKCSKGHKWKTAIVDRALAKHGCPKCSVNKKYSFPEKAIFYYLKKYFKNTIENYKIPNTKNLEVDIYIQDIMVGIEYDGRQYHKNVEKDIRKDKICADNNITLIRIREKGLPVLNSTCICFDVDPIRNIDLNRAILFIFNHINKKTEKNFKLDIDIERDFPKIYELMSIYEDQKSLGKLYPEIAKEWHPTKNGKITPFMISANSNKAVWWKCENGHEWKVSPNQRVYYNSKCPHCHKEYIYRGENLLANAYPELLKEWNFEKNTNISPYEMASGSSKKVWWKCSKGHEWEATIQSRTLQHQNCPYCCNQKILKGYNDLATTNPELLKEWDFEKNTDVSPYEISAGTIRKVWWKCEKGHSWQAAVVNRKNGIGCPYCSGKRILAGYNDLFTRYPFLFKEWNFEKNIGINTEALACRSTMKVWWKCSACGNEWQANIASRVLGAKCPKCKNKPKL